MIMSASIYYPLIRTQKNIIKTHYKHHKITVKKTKNNNNITYKYKHKR